MVNLAQQFKCFSTVKSLFSVPPRYSENGRRSISLRSRWHAPQSGPSTILLCYFRRRRYLERFFFLLSAGFRSFECVLVTVGINRVVDGRRGAAESETERIHRHGCAQLPSPPMLSVRSAVSRRRRWCCRPSAYPCPSNRRPRPAREEKNDAFGSKLTGN